MKQELINLTHLLRELQKIDTEFPLQYAVCLCEIAMHEGISLTQLSLRVGIPLSTTSRIVGALSKFRQKGKPYGLVNVIISPQERRRKELYLTSKGKNIIKNITELINDIKTGNSEIASSA